MPNNLKDYNYLIVYNLLNNKTKIIITNESYKSEYKEEIILQSENLNQEELTIKNNIYESLSNEAKELINIIINSPKELFELLLLTPKKKIISFKKFKEIMYEYWNSKFIVENTIKEIKNWLKQL